MAEARPKNTPALRQSKYRPPKPRTVVLSEPRGLDDEIGNRSETVALASRREWKERLHQLIDIHYLKTPLKHRQWLNVLDIAGECARVPGTTKIDNEKRNSMVGFLCRAIDRGEFKDGKGRMQVANLHPSPILPIRLDLKWLTFDQLLSFAKDGFLFIRRRECIEAFSRNNIDFPATWLPSELTGPDVPNTGNLPPTPPTVEECWKAIDEPSRRQRERHRAWRARRQCWPEGGPPRYMTVQQIADRMMVADPSHHAAGGFSASTVRRLLKR